MIRTFHKAGAQGIDNMKNMFFFGLLLVVLLSVTSCQDELEARGDFVIPIYEPYIKEWEALEPFYENGFWGYKDALGNIVVEPQHLWTEEFSEGLGLVIGTEGREDQTGFVDVEGNLVISLPTFICVTSRFSNGFAPVIVREWEYKTDELLTMVWPPPGPTIFINRKGENVFGREFFSAGEFSEGLAFVWGMEGREDETGFIDLNGNLVIPLPNAISVGRFSEGFVWVSIRKWDRANENPRLVGPSGPVIFIDRAGNDVFGQEFESVRPFSNGLAAVLPYRGNWVFIDTTGKNAFGKEFDIAWGFDGEYAQVVLLDGTRTHINRSGEIVNRGGW